MSGQSELCLNAKKLKLWKTQRALYTGDGPRNGRQSKGDVVILKSKVNPKRGNVCVLIPCAFFLPGTIPSCESSEKTQMACRPGIP